MKSAFYFLSLLLSISCATASESGSEKIIKKPWYEPLKMWIKGQNKEQKPEIHDDAWGIIVPYAINGGRDLKTYSILSQVSTTFQNKCNLSLEVLDLYALSNKTRYRYPTFLAYILLKHLPQRFANLRALSLNFEDQDSQYDFKEVAVKLEKPNQYLDLKKTLSSFTPDARLNSLTLVDSGVEKVISVEDPSELDEIVVLGAWAYKVEAKRRILQQKHDLADVTFDAEPIKENMIGCISLSTLTSLTVGVNYFFGYKEFTSRFLSALPLTLQHLAFLSPQTMSGLDKGTFKVSDLPTYSNLANLISLDLCLYNGVENGFEGWQFFEKLTSLTFPLKESAFGHSLKQEESLGENLPQLTALTMIQVRSDVFPRLQKFANLKHLGFVDSAINDEDLRAIANMSMLESLNLIYIKPFVAYNAHCTSRDSFTTEGIKCLKEKRPDLRITIQEKSPDRY